MHELSGPIIDGTAMRWFVDFGGADQREALSNLAELLAALPDVQIRKIIVGVEQAR